MLAVLVRLLIAVGVARAVLGRGVTVALVVEDPAGQDVLGLVTGRCRLRLRVISAMTLWRLSSGAHAIRMRSSRLSFLLFSRE